MKQSSPVYRACASNITVYDLCHYVWLKNCCSTQCLKGKSGQKISYTQMKEREKCKTTSHHWPQCAKWFSRYHILKSAIWARWTSPFCRFLASFSFENDVTDAILQNNEKMKVQYLRILTELSHNKHKGINLHAGVVFINYNPVLLQFYAQFYSNSIQIYHCKNHMTSFYFYHSIKFQLTNLCKGWKITCILRRSAL